MPHLCDNTYQQSPGESLHNILLANGFSSDNPPVRQSRRFRHIVNPFSAGPGSQAQAMQALTFAAMQQAADCVEGNPTDGAVRQDVRFRAAAMPGDIDFAKRFFPDTVPLSRSILDVRTFEVPRPLPLLFDLIEAALGDDVDTIIFTNVDILPLPHFYAAISRLLDYGFDMLVINRRTIDAACPDPSLLSLLFADCGRRHEGHDCFVLSVAAIRRFIRTNACVGAAAVMRGLIYNMVASATRMLILTDVHLTCHLGDDKTWASPALEDYIHHNWDEAIALLRQLAPAHPDRFTAFCEALPDRVRIQRDPQGIRIVKAPGSNRPFPKIDS